MVGTFICNNITPACISIWPIKHVLMKEGTGTKLKYTKPIYLVRKDLTSVDWMMGTKIQHYIRGGSHRIRKTHSFSEERTFSSSFQASVLYHKVLNKIRGRSSNSCTETSLCDNGNHRNLAQ